MQETGDRGAEFPEPDDQGGAAVQDVAAATHDGFGGEDDGLADEEVLGVLQRRTGDGDHRAGKFVEAGVAAVAVLGILDHPEELTGEASTQVGQGRSEVAADVEQRDRLGGGPGLEVVQGRVRVGEQLPGEHVDSDGLLDLASGGGVDRLGLGQYGPQPAHRRDRADEAGTLGQQMGDQEGSDLLVGGEPGDDLCEVGVQAGAFKRFHRGSPMTVQRRGRW